MTKTNENVVQICTIEGEKRGRKRTTERKTDHTQVTAEEKTIEEETQSMTEEKTYGIEHKLKNLEERFANNHRIPECEYQHVIDEHYKKTIRERQGWETVKRYGKRFEDRVNSTILNAEEPRYLLSMHQKAYFHLLCALRGEEHAKAYASERVSNKINTYLDQKLETLASEKRYLEQMIDETNSNIAYLRKGKSMAIRAATRYDRDRADAYHGYTDLQETIVGIIADLEKAEQMHSPERDMTKYIETLERGIEAKEAQIDRYGEMISQARSNQEAEAERYELLVIKLNEQRSIRSELRKYKATIDKIPSKLDIYKADGSRKEYQKQLERITEVKEIITASVSTINRLVESSYITQDLFARMPACDELKISSIENNGSYDERKQHDLANQSGKSLAERLRSKRKDELFNTYMLQPERT